MTQKPTSFFGELKQRNVIRVGIGYAVAAWLIAQVADLVLESFEAPSWAMQSLLLALALGLPVALLLAWIFEITPEGIKRETDVDRSDPGTRKSGRKTDFAIIALLSVALAYFVTTHDWVGNNAPGPDTGPKSIAVLPFENMSERADNAFFASGVHEDILTYLAKIADLRVIARSSVQPFADNTTGIAAIAAALNVDHIVEGSVRRAGNRVRVTAQLIDAKTEEHLWAENYDRDLSDVFEIQTEIAREIVAALEARLSADEEQALQQVPTRNIDAYDQYARAREIGRGSIYSAAQITAMEPLLEKAVELDPDFAVAHAMLGSVHTNMYWLEVDRSAQRLNLAKASIDRAFELQPDLPEARAALAEYYYRGFNNYERALEELEAAHKRFPNNATILETLGVTQRRLGMWDEAMESLRAATQLDPGAMSKKRLLLETLVAARRWPAAAEYADALLSAHPDDSVFKALRSEIYRSGYGDLDGAAAVLAGAEPVLHPDFFVANLFVLFAKDDLQGALDLTDDYAEMFAGFPAGGTYFLKSWIYGFMGDEATAERYAAKAVEALAPFEEGDNVNWLTWKAISAESYVRIGQTEQGVRLARRILASDPVSLDAFDGPEVTVSAGRVLALAGQTDEGLDILERYLDQPGGPTRWDLRLHPRWDFLRDNPRFARLAAATPATGE